MDANQKKAWADLIKMYPKGSTEVQVIVAVYNAARKGDLVEGATNEEIVKKIAEALARQPLEEVEEA